MPENQLNTMLTRNATARKAGVDPYEIVAPVEDLTLEWDESRHPRDHGKFTSGETSSGKMPSKSRKNVNVKSDEAWNNMMQDMMSKHEEGVGHLENMVKAHNAHTAAAKAGDKDGMKKAKADFDKATASAKQAHADFGQSAKGLKNTYKKGKDDDYKKGKDDDYKKGRDDDYKKGRDDDYKKGNDADYKKGGAAKAEKRASSPKGDNPLESKSVDTAGGGEPSHAVAVVRNNQGKFLIGKSTHDDPKRNGKWEFPGGGMKKGEDVKSGAGREFKEETGLRAKPAGGHFVNDKKGQPNVAHQPMTVHPKDAGKTPKPNGEYSKMKWASPAEIAHLDKGGKTHPGMMKGMLKSLGTKAMGKLKTAAHAIKESFPDIAKDATALTVAHIVAGMLIGGASHEIGDREYDLALELADELNSPTPTE